MQESSLICVINNLFSNKPVLLEKRLNLFVHLLGLIKFLAKDPVGRKLSTLFPLIEYPKRLILLPHPGNRNLDLHQHLAQMQCLQLSRENMCLIFYIMPVYRKERVNGLAKQQIFARWHIALFGHQFLCHM